MSVKLLITGSPRCGKSTLILRLISYYEGKRTIYGFLTPEVRVKNQRVGFDVKDIRTKQRTELARESKSYKGHDMVGKYQVFTENFEKYVDRSLNLNLAPSNLIIIDEIGKMELYSELFQNYIRNLFKLEINIIATIGEKISHPIKDYILKIPEVLLFQLTRQNQSELFDKIISLIN